MNKTQWILMFFTLSGVCYFDGSQAAEQGLKQLPKKKQTQKQLPNGEDSFVWIKRSDGALSCGMEKAQSLEMGAAELKKANIRIFGSRKSNDGQMHIQMCGAPTGSENAYLIQKGDLPKAISLGFQGTHQKSVHQ